MKKLIVTLCIIANTLLAQTKDITLNFTVYLDNKKIETDKVLIGIIRKDSISEYSIISNQFTTFLTPGRVYNMVISHPSYNKQIFKINTNLLKSDINKIDVYLSTNQPNRYTDTLEYNKLLKKYIIYD